MANIAVRTLLDRGPVVISGDGGFARGPNTGLPLLGRLSITQTLYAAPHYDLIR